MKNICQLNWSIEHFQFRLKICSLVFLITMNFSLLIINHEEFKVCFIGLSFKQIELFVLSLVRIDYQANQWKIDEQTGKKERLCTYNVHVTAVFGETTISSNEKQVSFVFVHWFHFVFFLSLNRSSKVN